jgi:hypothetical protein
MIISASRRCDMPTFQMDKFIDYYNRHIDNIEFIVFWTSNGEQLIKCVENGLINKPFYTQFTMIYYPPVFYQGQEPIELRLDNFKKLSELTNYHTIWRYDPIIISDITPVTFHMRNFEHIAKELANYTRRCVVSIFDHYNAAIIRMNKAGITGVRQPLKNEVNQLANAMINVCSQYGIELVSCSELLLKNTGILPGKCIDDVYIKEHFNVNVANLKDSTQRLACGCVQSLDIGKYGNCPHKCVYCYANNSLEL